MTRQTYPSIEHIVIDGGSSDGTLDVVRTHRPPHRTDGSAKQTAECYEAINKGIAMARGDILAYLNSDDLYLPWSVEVAVRALEHPGAELIYGDMGILRFGTRDRTGTLNILFYPKFKLSYYSFVDAIGQPTVFWRRSLTQRIGVFDVRYRLIGDWEYWLRAALHGTKPMHVAELLALQVEHGSTLRATQPAKLLEEFNTLRRAMEAALDPLVRFSGNESRRASGGECVNSNSSTR